MAKVPCVSLTHCEATGEWKILEQIHDRHQGLTRWYVRDRDAAHRHFEAVKAAHQCTQ